MSTHDRKCLGIVFVSVIAGFSGMGWADTIVDPVDASASSFLNFGTNNDNDRVPSNTIGIPGPGDVVGFSGTNAGAMLTGDPVPSDDTQYPDQSTDPGTMWLTTTGQPVVGAWIEWDLGPNFAQYNLTGFHLWNYNEGGTLSDRGVDSGTLSFSNDSTFASSLSSQNFNFLQATESNSYTGTTYSLTGPASAEFVRLTVNTNWGDTGYDGLSEIRFINGTPEPASMGLIATGVGALLVRRRRRHV